MLRTLRPFFISLLCTWLGLGAAAIAYWRAHAHSEWILTAALPAFFFETIFYLGSVFEETRERFGKLRATRLKAAIVWLSGLGPYLIFSLAAHTFQRNAFYLLAGLTALLAFWFAFCPRRPAYDVGFLAIAAAPQIGRVFSRIYAAPDPQISILGHLAWIHVGVAALLTLREWNAGGFSFWPTPREWQTGLFLFLLSIAPLIGLGLQINAVHFVLPHAAWWLLAGQAFATFFGILWVVALSEELFFRGFIQKALQKPLPAVFAIPLAALVFGAAHLWNNHQFPNWRQALVAALLGVACGIAYRWAGSVRASMVTHAFAVVTWRLFFRA